MKRVDLPGFEQELQASFADFAGKRALLDPGFMARARRVGTRAGVLTSPFALFSGAGRLRDRRFLFFSTRFSELASAFGRDEAAIIGGPRDFRVAVRLGLPFVFTGDLAAAAASLLFGQRWIPAARVLQSWSRFFSRQAKDCVLVMPNDTLPMSLLLVHIARRCPNITVVCLQHGLFNSGMDLDDIEGRNSAVNLVYSPAQRRELERRLPGALVEVMGLPTQLHCTEGGSIPTRRALLVGPGTLDDRGAYRRTLAVYARVAERLNAAGFEVKYRPHPNEAGVDEGKDAFALDHSTKLELLSGPRRAFIGLNSTLLCEAQAAGHAVMVLDDPTLPSTRIEDFGVVVGSDSLESLVPAIDSQASAVTNHGFEPLRSRFETALARARSRAALA
jgi:hypothetical protein